MVFSNNLLMGAAGQATGYEIDQSIRFNDDDSAHLSRTPGSAGNRKTWTLSWWAKRGNLGIRTQMFAIPAAGGNQFIIEFDLGDGGGGGNDQLVFNNETTGTTALNWELEIAFRDPAAWYHFVAVYDTTQSTANDRFKCFVNGALQTEWDRNTTPGQNEEQAWNNALEHKIGGKHHANAGYFDGYMAEIHFIDGTAKTASDFGEYNNDGVWIPKAYSGSYGTNGFFIDGRDSSDLGDDESGNGNDFASSGLAAADQMPDTPTLNHWTLNPLDSGSGLANGNLQDLGGNSTHTHSPGFPITGKWYWEIVCTDINTGTAGAHFFAITDASVAYSAGFSAAAAISAGTQRGGQLKKNNSNTSTGTAIGDGDIVGMAFDADNLTLDILVNNSASGSQITGLTAGQYKIWIQNGAATTNMTFNFAEASFEYTPPTGFKALSTANLPTPTISDGSKYFQTALYTGTTGAQDITFSGNSDLAPDWLWFKARSAGSDHFLFDKVRGALKTISSNDNTAEESSTGSMTAFGTDGFSLGDGGTANDINGVSGTTYAAWGWSAGNSTGSSNTDGDITSTVTANTTSGFSVLTYTGNGSDNQEIGHGIGIAPKMIFSKRTNTTGNWTMYHDAVGINKVMYLNLTNLPASNTEQYRATPSSSVYTVGVGGDINASGGSYVAYCFAEVEGFSKMGSYVANASTDGPFIYCGFHPGFVIFFSIAGSGAGRWMLDPTRSPFNPADDIFQANTTASEDTNSSYNLDFLSNGFKVRTASDFNSSGRTIAFAAFAENPFGGDGIAPGTAR